MVKKEYEHFDAVCTASASLVASGFVPVPHCPACRFDSVEQLDSTLARLRASGAKSVLLLGGNDQHARSEMGVPFPCAGSLIEMGALRKHGFESVAVAGHPRWASRAGQEREPECGRPARKDDRTAR